jgi:hypothetical protein
MKHDWILIDLRGGTWKCLRCKEEIKTPLPCRIDTAAELAKAFGKIHKKCKANTRVPRISFAEGATGTLDIQVYSDGLKTNPSKSDGNNLRE